MTTAKDPAAKLVDMYRAAMNDEAESNWVRGDIAIQVIKLAEDSGQKPHNSAIVKDFLTSTGESTKSFHNRARVSLKFPSSGAMRKMKLDWTMFRIAAGTDDPEKWLKEANDNSWTVRQFSEELDKANGKKKADTGTPCKCGCGQNIPEEPISLGGVERGRLYFAEPSCVVRFLTERMNHTVSPQIIQVLSDSEEGQEIADEDFDLDLASV